MKRVTERCCNGFIAKPYGFTEQQVLNRLAEYEDTGLTPEDIQEAVDLFKDWKDADIPKELKSWVERCTWHVRKSDELRRKLDKYENAEEQGLLVRLPCKVGDTVYVTFRNGAKPYVVDRIYINGNSAVMVRMRFMVNETLRLSSDEFGKTVFLTREAAEKALEDA